MKEFKEKKFIIFFKKIITVSIFILVFLNIDSLSSMAIKMIKIVEESPYFLNGSLDFIKKTYNLVQPLVIYILVFSIIAIVILNSVIKFKDYNRNLDFRNNVFEKSLHNYLESEKQKKGYLITGEWGSGKTYILNTFMDKVYRYSRRPIYNISCYGLNNRELVINEINNQLEINDHSLLSWVKYIPLIGDPLYAFLNEASTLPNIKKNSIFIFDDFERITPMKSISEFNHNTFEYKRPNSFRDSFRTGSSSFQEFEDINDEFKKIAQSINFNSKMDNQILKQKYLSQYNAITGLINELIEYYGFKVIIVCNTDILGYDYMDEIFRGKLDCITYRQSPNLNTIENIFTEAFDNQVFTNNKTKDIIKNNKDDLYEDFFVVWKRSNYNNLRLVNSLINSYFSTLNKFFSDKQPTKSFLYSLFYSMFATILLRDNEKQDVLSRFLPGGNLGFYLNLYEPDTFIDIFQYSRHYENLQWTGISISGPQILNMTYPENFSHLLNKFESYPYAQLEKELIKLKNKELQSFKFDSYDLISTGELLEIHYSYFIKINRSNLQEEKDIVFEKINDAFLKSFSTKLTELIESDSSIHDEVTELLLNIQKIFDVSKIYFSHHLDDLFENIYIITMIKSLKQPTNESHRIIDSYNNYVNHVRERLIESDTY